MGCDIHMVMQVRVGGEWSTVDDEVLGEPRSYASFGLLAGVRNAVGFAGVRTGVAVEPISPPRGLPADFKLDSGEESLDYPSSGGKWLGDHSHSWLSLADVEGYPHWSRKSVRSAVVPEDEFLRLQASGGEPEWSAAWSSAATVSDVEYLLMRESERAALRLRADGDLWVTYRWTTPLTRHGFVYSDLLPLMRQRAASAGVGPDDVRVVFGFDS